MAAIRNRGFLTSDAEPKEIPGQRQTRRDPLPSPERSIQLQRHDLTAPIAKHLRDRVEAGDDPAHPETAVGHEVELKGVLEDDVGVPLSQSDVAVAVLVGEGDVIRMLLVGGLGRGEPGWIVP